MYLQVCISLLPLYHVTVYTPHLLLFLLLLLRLLRLFPSFLLLPLFPLFHAQVAVTFLGDDSLVSVSLNGDLNVLNMASPEAPTRVMMGHKTQINAMAFRR